MGHLPFTIHFFVIRRAMSLSFRGRPVTRRRKSVSRPEPDAANGDFVLLEEVERPQSGGACWQTLDALLLVLFPPLAMYRFLRRTVPGFSICLGVPLTYIVFVATLFVSLLFLGFVNSDEFLFVVERVMDAVNRAYDTLDVLATNVEDPEGARPLANAIGAARFVIDYASSMLNLAHRMTRNVLFGQSGISVSYERAHNLAISAMHAQVRLLDHIGQILMGK